MLPQTPFLKSAFMLAFMTCLVAGKQSIRHGQGVEELVQLDNYAKPLLFLEDRFGHTDEMCERSELKKIYVHAASLALHGKIYSYYHENGDMKTKDTPATTRQVKDGTKDYWDGRIFLLQHGGKSTPTDEDGKCYHNKGFISVRTAQSKGPCVGADPCDKTKSPVFQKQLTGTAFAQFVHGHLFNENGFKLDVKKLKEVAIFSCHGGTQAKKFYKAIKDLGAENIIKVHGPLLALASHTSDYPSIKVTYTIKASQLSKCEKNAANKFKIRSPTVTGNFVEAAAGTVPKCVTIAPCSNKLSVTSEAATKIGAFGRFITTRAADFTTDVVKATKFRKHHTSQDADAVKCNNPQNSIDKEGNGESCVDAGFWVRINEDTFNDAGKKLGPA